MQSLKVVRHVWFIADTCFTAFNFVHDTLLDTLSQLTSAEPLRALCDQVTPEAVAPEHTSRHPLHVLLAALPCYTAARGRVPLRTARTFFITLRNAVCALPTHAAPEPSALRPALALAPSSPRRAAQDAALRAAVPAAELRLVRQALLDAVVETKYVYFALDSFMQSSEQLQPQVRHHPSWRAVAFCAFLCRVLGSLRVVETRGSLSTGVRARSRTTLFGLASRTRCKRTTLAAASPSRSRRAASSTA